MATGKGGRKWTEASRRPIFRSAYRNGVPPSLNGAGQQVCVVAVETVGVTTCPINLSDVKTYADHFDGGSAFSAANVTFSNGTVACNLPDGGTHVDGAVCNDTIQAHIGT